LWLRDRMSVSSADEFLLRGRASISRNPDILKGIAAAPRRHHGPSPRQGR
jgi:hypothetical protein